MDKHLIAVERWTLILAALVVGSSILVLDRHTAFSASIGAVLAALNAYAQRRIGRRVFKTFKRPGAAILLLNVKMGVLIALVWIIIKYLHVDPIAFIVGISLFPAAIVATAIHHTLRPDSGEGNEEQHG
jgi:hypothetical protein